MRRLTTAAVLMSLALCSGARVAATPPPPPMDHAQQRILAGGYRALTTCSAIFNAQRIGATRTPESVEANELVGIYPELNPYVRDGSITVERNHVLVRIDAAQPPLIAYWQPEIGGCTLLRFGSDVRGAIDPARPGPVQTTPNAAPWPNGQACPPNGTPESAAAVSAARAGRYGADTNTTAIVIVEGGCITEEAYAPGFSADTPQRTWSVAKSIAATIIGAAVQRGEVNVTAPAAIANWQGEDDPRRAITLDNLLHMASGLTSDSAGNRTDAIYFGGTTVDEQAPSWPLIAPPGSTFRYANNDTLLAVLAISPTFARHPPRDFFASVSMHSTVAETDWRGNYVLSSQVWATARDLARFGMLYLNDGVWNGRRILPQGWRTYVSTPSGPQPPGDFGYGASFWLMNRSDGVPRDTIAAFGNRGQYVVIIPSRNIVIVRRGEDPAGARFDIAAFTRDIVAALDNGVNTHP